MSDERRSVEDQMAAAAAGWDGIITRSYQFTAEPYPPMPHVVWWRKAWLRLRRKPLPRPIQPPGTQPLVIDQTDPDTGRRVRFYVPAARFDASTSGGVGEPGTNE